MNLNFLRNVDKKEVDFFVTVDNKPWFAVEVKISDTSVKKVRCGPAYKRDSYCFCGQVPMWANIARPLQGTRRLSAIASSGEAGGHLFRLDVACDFITPNK